jgi:hypothetical protein
MPKEPAVAIAAKSQVARARAAERMRRSRNRRRGDLRCYILELRESEIEALVRRGFLSPDERTNRSAVVKAMYAFLDGAFGRPA